MNSLTTAQLRRIVRAVSYLAAAVLTLAASLLIHVCREAELRQEAENASYRAFAELAENVDGMSTSLRKSLYVNSPELMCAMCTDIYGRAMAAQMSLEALPYTDIPLENTAGFIARVGDYAYALERKTSGGERPGEEEFNNLTALYEAAEKLSQSVSAARRAVYDGQMSLDGIRQEGELPTVGSTAQRMENDFPELPSLIYDGPFSEHTESMEPRMLAGRREVTAEEAAGIARQFLGLGESAVSFCSEGGGEEIPAWCFNCQSGRDSLFCRVSKQGGEIVSFFSSREAGEPELEEDEAVRIAIGYLAKRGITDIETTYTQRENGTLLVNFTASQDGVTLYPDLIKVRVALDTGKVVGYDAVGYLMCHCERVLPKETVSEEQAISYVNPTLRVLSTKFCLIPTAGKSEIFCRQVTCLTPQNTHCLVYINAETGREEKVLLLLEDENGTLTI